MAGTAEGAAKAREAAAVKRKSVLEAKQREQALIARHQGADRHWISKLPDEERAALLERAMERYRRGEAVSVIAGGLNVSQTTLYNYFISEKQEAWRDAKVSRSLSELEAAEEEMKTARLPLTLSRARERARAAQWQLERLLRRIYGQEQQQGQTALVHIQIANLRGDSATKPPVILSVRKAENEESST